MNNSWLDLEGKVAIVTGGSSGIGFAIAKELVNNGAKVIISDLVGEEGQQADGSFLIKCDVTNKESVDRMINKVIEQYGKLDILVNNAGVNLPRLLVDIKGEKPQYELNEKDFDFMVAVNQKGPYLCAQAAAKEMLKQGKGVIINVASGSGSRRIGRSELLFCYQRSANLIFSRMGKRVRSI